MTKIVLRIVLTALAGSWYAAAAFFLAPLVPGPIAIFVLLWLGLILLFLWGLIWDLFPKKQNHQVVKNK